MSAEVLFYRADGSPFWSHVSITPIRDAAGAVANFVAVQRDVSQRKAAEAAVQMREQALSNLSEGICISDATRPDCPLVYVNHAFERCGAGGCRAGACRAGLGPVAGAAAQPRLVARSRAHRPLPLLPSSTPAPPALSPHPAASPATRGAR